VRIEQIRPRAWFIGSLCAVSLLLLKHLLVPLNPDNDTYQSMAWQLYEYGRLPYLGSWDQNFPGIVYLHWLAIAVFGNSEIGFRALDAIFHLTNAALLFKITSNWFDPKMAALTSLLYALYYTHDSYWLAGQRDGFAVTFILLALWVFLNSKSSGSLLLVGLSIGCATVIRPTYGLFALALLFVSKSSMRSKLRPALLMALGGTIVWSVQLVPYFFADGGLHECYMATIRFTADLYGGYALPWSNLLLWNRAQKIYFTILFIGLIVMAIRHERIWPDDPILQRLFLLLFIASLLPVLVMRKFSIYHFDPLFTLLTPVCAYLLLRTAEEFRKYRMIALVLFLAVIGIRMFPRHVVKEYLKAPGSDLASRLEHVYARIDSDSLYGAAAERDLSQYVKINSPAEATIEFATIWPGAGWKAERRLAGRFTTWYALGMTRASGDHLEYQHQWQREYLDSIERVKPEMIIIAKGPRSFLLRSEHEPWNKYFMLPGMRELMQSRYEFDTVIRGFDIYRLRS
jgi:hypothetical protein